MTTIEWVRNADGGQGLTWNPVIGCTRVSEGCDHCYIERTPPFRIEGRKFIGTGPGSSTGVRLHPDRLDTPLRRRKPTTYFMSMSDLFHDDVPDEFIARVFAVMGLCYGGSGFPGCRGGERPAHTFQILTKRPARMARLLADEAFADLVQWEVRNEVCREFDIDGGLIEWPLSNVWLGTSVENQKWADVRIPHLLRTAAAVRFLSCEPLLGPVNLARWNVPGRNVVPCQECGRDRWSGVGPCGKCGAPAPGGIDWVIVGGESGPGARPMHPKWARSLRDQCVAASVPFFFKQWGEHRPLHPGEASYGPGRVCVSEDGTAYEWDAETICYGNESDGEMMLRVGKKAAGRELDGRTWDEMPRAAEVVAS